MAEHLRTTLARLRKFFKDRRSSPRRKVRFNVSVAVVAERDRHKQTSNKTLAHASSQTASARLEGYTQDISRNGMALVMPTVRIGDQYLTGTDCLLQITLKLPDAEIAFRAAPVRYEKLDATEGHDDGNHTAYIIGVRILEMDEGDRSLYIAQLQA